MTDKELLSSKRIHREGGWEVWITYDPSAAIFEMWASGDIACDDYIGCADTEAEAKAFAVQWVVERLREGREG